VSEENMTTISNNVMASGLEGYQQASKQMQRASADIAQGQRQNADFTTSAVNLQSASLQAQASAEVIRKADGMIGTIIDIFV